LFYKILNTDITDYASIPIIAKIIIIYHTSSHDKNTMKKISKAFKCTAIDRNRERELVRERKYDLECDLELERERERELECKCDQESLVPSTSLAAMP